MSRLESETRFKPSEYKVINGLDAEIIKEALGSKIKLWHEQVRPTVIVLTATSSVLSGLVLKHAWKNLYSGEHQPKFLLIDPRRIEGYVGHNPDQAPQKKKSPMPSKDVLKNDDTVLVFDEFTTASEHSLNKYNPASDNEPKHKARPRQGVAGLYLAADYVFKQGVKNVWTDSVSHDVSETLYAISKTEHPILLRSKEQESERSHDWERYVHGRSEYDVNLISDLKTIAEEISKP